MKKILLLAVVLLLLTGATYEKNPITAHSGYDLEFSVCNDGLNFGKGLFETTFISKIFNVKEATEDTDKMTLYGRIGPRMTLNPTDPVSLLIGLGFQVESVARSLDFDGWIGAEAFMKDNEYNIDPVFHGVCNLNITYHLGEK
jgi:hypothetical protein